MNLINFKKIQKLSCGWYLSYGAMMIDGKATMLRQASKTGSIGFKIVVYII